MEGFYKTADKFAKPSAGKQIVEDYREKIKNEAEQMVLDIFPQKLMELDELVNSAKFTVTDLSAIHADLNIPVPDPLIFNNNDNQLGIGVSLCKKRKLDGSVEGINDDGSEQFTNGFNIKGTKVMLFPKGTVEINTKIAELCDVCKPFIRELVEYTNKLKLWILFLIPRIEDGNNFGVSIQEETLSEIRTIETEAAAFFDNFSRYFSTRGNIISKIAKYPHIQDYRRSINEVDEKQLLNVRLILSELRNHYATLHDMITKNLEKIKRPRTCNTESMY